MTYKNKSLITKKKAFTLIELLIVIAIIGILFIVLVSKVDFATDKAKATGVQTDFRSFQMAFDTVAKENAGFNTFGWDTGDANQNGKRDSYDEGDNGAGGGTAKNGIQDGTEVFTGHKVYDETFTKVFSLKKNGTGSYDREALNRLEAAINANLDPKLHITIKDDGRIVMANGARDPWNKEYHGYYISNAETDGKDRGAIVMYSDGANNEFGSEHAIAYGVVSVTVPNSNKDGKDDYSIVSCYTYINGYGEVKNMTTGFSSNQSFLANGTASNSGGNTPNEPVVTLNGGLYKTGTNYTEMIYSWQKLLDDDIVVVENGTVTTHFDDGEYSNTSSAALEGELVLPSDGSITSIGYCGFAFCDKLVTVVIPNSVTTIGDCAFMYCFALQNLDLPNSIENIGDGALSWCSILDIVLPNNLTQISEGMFLNSSLTSITISNSVTKISEHAFDGCENLKNITFNGTVEQWESIEKDSCWKGTAYWPEYSAISASCAQCIDGQALIYKNGIDFLLQDDDTCKALYAIRSSEPLTELIIPSEFKGYVVTELGVEFCWYKTNLQSVTIPASVTQINNYAFDECISLTNITFEGTMEQWKSITFGTGWDRNVPATYVQCSDGRILRDGSEYHEECEVVIQDLDCSGPHNVRYYVYENNILVEKTASISAGSGITIYAAAETDIYIDTNNTIGVYNSDYDYDQSINKYNYADDGVYVTVPVIGYCIIDIFS